MVDVGLLVATPADPQTFIQSVIQEMDNERRQDGPVLIVAKSLGPMGAFWGADRGYPAVWLTPVLAVGGGERLPDGYEAVAERIRAYPADNLVVGRTSDAFWQPGFQGTGEVIEIDQADHSLEVADWRQSMRHHESVATAIADFASTICGQGLRTLMPRRVDQFRETESAARLTPLDA